MSKQRGSGVVLFILVILVLSDGIIAGSIYIKNSNSQNKKNFSNSQINIPEASLSPKEITSLTSPLPSVSPEASISAALVCPNNSIQKFTRVPLFNQATFNIPEGWYTTSSQSNEVT